jgi:hypothetical protein
MLLAAKVTKTPQDGLDLGQNAPGRLLFKRFPSLSQILLKNFNNFFPFEKLDALATKTTTVEYDSQKCMNAPSYLLVGCQASV